MRTKSLATNTILIARLKNTIVLILAKAKHLLRLALPAFVPKLVAVLLLLSRGCRRTFQVRLVLICFFLNGTCEEAWGQTKSSCNENTGHTQIKHSLDNQNTADSR